MNFEEWKEKNLAKGESKSWIEWCEESYQAGAQSQQAKIDILQIKLNGADERAAAVLNHKNKMIDELQARVDVALELLNDQHDQTTVRFIRNAMNNVLKGNKDEK